MAIVGGAVDSQGLGAAWIFMRTNGAWSQQGSKLVGTGAIGGARQGQSVAISADASTAIVGGYMDNSSLGAAWVFGRLTHFAVTAPSSATAGAGFNFTVTALDSGGNIVSGYSDKVHFSLHPHQRVAEPHGGGCAHQ